MFQRGHAPPATDPRVKSLHTVLEPLAIVPPYSVQHPLQHSQAHPIPGCVGGACGVPLARLCIVTLHSADCCVPVPPADGVEFLVRFARVQSVRLHLCVGEWNGMG